jgi:outer membrane protein insertion porin family
MIHGMAGPPGQNLIGSGTHPLARAAALLLVAAAVLMPGSPTLAAAAPRGTITEVQVVGNSSVATEDIVRKISSRAGRELDPATLEADYRALMASRWFSDVKMSSQKDPKKEDGLILIFSVTEMPVIRSVTFRGRDKIKQKELEENTSLKPGARADHLKAQLAVRQIERVYQDKGYEMAEVKLLKGGKPGELDIVFEIFEGPKGQVSSIWFTGNTIVTDATLKTKIMTRAPILGIAGGRYSKEMIEEDARKLRQYYQGMGFFEVKVAPVTRPGDSAADLKLEFVIWEGPRYKVRKVEFEGEKLIADAKLREGLVMHSGQPFSDVLFEADRKTLESKYGEIGCIDAQIDVERRYVDPANQPGLVDLIYRIEEGDPYILGHFIVKGNERTRDYVVRREAEMAGLVPGEPINMKRVEQYKKRLEGLRFFVADPQMGRPIDIQLTNRRPSAQPYGDVPMSDLDEVVRTRFQSPGPEFPPAEENLNSAPSRVARRQGEGGLADPLPPPPDLGPLPPIGAGAGDPLFGSSEAFAPPPGRTPDPILVPGPAPDLPPLTGPPGLTNGAPKVPIGEGEPKGVFPSLPGSNMTNVGPDLNEPFAGRSYADIVTQVEEAPTGKLMFGVGATSYGGLSGNFILHESNFDILAVPRSWRELFSGQAFRGAGQELRIELSPGTLINRFLVSFRDPYLFDLPGGYAIGFGASGYVFSRFYQGQYNEGRGGGRFSLGSQLGTSTYADLAVRVEDVNVTGFDYPAPAPYLAAAGHTFLTSLKPSLRYDNRNDPFAPNKGQYLEAAFEQGWGDFTWPKFTLEGRQYFTLRNRPDGTGKHILTFRGFFGIAGSDLPVYERFFAGDFRSMRGFTYRGVGPFELNRNVGGIMSAIGSVEYQFPWIASDKLQQVVFADFGTVAPDYQFSTFRCTVGTGLRIYLPQQMFGPLPLAFDFAVPVAKGPDDREQLVTFFIGAFW